MSNNNPNVSGLSPKEGIPGTQITIRGENLGTDREDLIALIICGTDCLLTAKWKSPNKIIARVGNARRGLGDIIIVTKSGGRGVSNVQFRVIIEQVGPLTESSVWVDESRTVPCRSVVRNVAEIVETSDALGLNKKSSNEHSKIGYNELIKLFPDASGNIRMNNFHTSWYLLENHKNASFTDLLKGIDHLKKEIAKERQMSNDVHRDNLYSLINCVDSLNSLHLLIENDAKQNEWPLTGSVTKLIDTTNRTADNLFSDVLSRKDRADSTRNALSVLTRFRFIFFLTETIDENLRKSDYAAILNDCARARALFVNSEVKLFKEVMGVLELKMEKFKEALKQRLINSPSSFDDQNRLIKYLKILDPNSNPAQECITSYHLWLEKELWELQNRYCKLANEEVNDQLEFANFESSVNYVQAFINQILQLLTEKLPTFWKLAQNYSDASDEQYLEHQDDINQMLINNINVSSWMMLNALIPNALPESVKQQYKNDFSDWPTQREKSVQLNQLCLALKSLRATIRSLLEAQFSRVQVTPLTELSKTIRLKSIEVLTNKNIEAGMALSSQETWNIEIDVRTPKTIVPDLFETQLNLQLSTINQILSVNGYPGEEDLFSKENIRQMIVDRIIFMICSMRDCYEQLLNTSDMVSNTSSNEDNIEKGRPSELLSRRLLICICNVEYLLYHSLPLICKKMAESIKYANLILEKSKQEFLSFREELINKYLTIKTSPLLSLIEASTYDHLPENDDVSSFVKELIMGIIFIQAELYILLPQLNVQILKSAVDNIIQKFMDFIADVQNLNDEVPTQIVVDLTAIEQTLNSFLSLHHKNKINSVRAKLISRLDKSLFDSSIQHFQQSMRVAIESLQIESGNSEDFDSSDV